jgi:hypothetical protein
VLGTRASVCGGSCAAGKCASRQAPSHGRGRFTRRTFGGLLHQAAGEPVGGREAERSASAPKGRGSIAALPERVKPVEPEKGTRDRRSTAPWHAWSAASCGTFMQSRKAAWQAILRAHESGKSHQPERVRGVPPHGAQLWCDPPRIRTTGRCRPGPDSTRVPPARSLNTLDFECLRASMGHGVATVP